MSAPECETLLLETKGSVLHLTLNRAKALNAMSLKMVHELNAVCEWLEGDSGVRAVVVRGAGGHFCAGGDIKDMAQARALAMSGDTGGKDPYLPMALLTLAGFCSCMRRSDVTKPSGKLIKLLKLKFQ